MSLRPNSRTEVRRNRYKVAVDAEEGRRRREDSMVEIRKSRKEENLQKKRREGLQAVQQQQQSSSAAVDKKVKPYFSVSSSKLVVLFGQFAVDRVPFIRFVTFCIPLDRYVMNNGSLSHVLGSF